MKLFPKSIRKHIRKEKSRIRRQIFDSAEKNRRVGELLEKLKTQYNEK